MEFDIWKIFKLNKKYVLALAVFSVLFIVACTTGNQQVPQANEGAGTPVELTAESKEFQMTAKQWKFTPSRIEVNKGDKVILNIKSIDVAHGFALPDFGVNERLEPGKEVTVEFMADKTGEFTFFCNVICGSGHGSMRGVLVVN